MAQGLVSRSSLSFVEHIFTYKQLTNVQNKIETLKTNLHSTIKSYQYYVPEEKELYCLQMLVVISVTLSSFSILWNNVRAVFHFDIL